MVFLKLTGYLLLTALWLLGLVIFAIVVTVAVGGLGLAIAEAFS